MANMKLKVDELSHGVRWQQWQWVAC